MWMGRKRDKEDRREWKRAEGGVFGEVGSWKPGSRLQNVGPTWKGATALHWRNTSKGLRLH